MLLEEYKQRFWNDVQSFQAGMSSGTFPQMFKEMVKQATSLHEGQERAWTAEELGILEEM